MQINGREDGASKNTMKATGQANSRAVQDIWDGRENGIHSSYENAGQENA